SRRRIALGSIVKLGRLTLKGAVLVRCPLVVVDPGSVSEKAAHAWTIRRFRASGAACQNPKLTAPTMASVLSSGFASVSSVKTTSYRMSTPAAKLGLRYSAEMPGAMTNPVSLLFEQASGAGGQSSERNVAAPAASPGRTTH